MNGRYPQNQDPGEIENRMSLNPSNPDWKDFLGGWSDGEEYTLKVKVRQVSPGEFEVMEATPQEESGETAAAPDNEGAEGEVAEGAAPEGVNPAVAKMMASKKY